MSDAKDVRILQPDGQWQSIGGRPGKDADMKRIEVLERKVTAIEAKLAGLPYGEGPGIEIT